MFYVALGFKIAQAVKDWQIAAKKTRQKFSFNVKSSCGIGILNVDVFEVRETPRILTTAANSQIVSPQSSVSMDDHSLPDFLVDVRRRCEDLTNDMRRDVKYRYLNLIKSKYFIILYFYFFHILIFYFFSLINNKIPMTKVSSPPLFIALILLFAPYTISVFRNK